MRDYNLRTNTPSGLLPLLSCINRLVHKHQFNKIDVILKEVMEEKSSVLVKVAVLRFTCLYKDRLHNWRTARDLFTRQIPDAKKVLHGLFDEDRR